MQTMDESIELRLNECNKATIFTGWSATHARVCTYDDLKCENLLYCQVVQLNKCLENGNGESYRASVLFSTPLPTSDAVVVSKHENSVEPMTTLVTSESMSTSVAMQATLSLILLIVVVIGHC